MADSNIWTQVLSDLESKDSGEISYLKDGKTRVKLVPEKGNDRQFFAEATRLWQGKPKQRFLVKGIIFKDDKDELKALVVTKTVLKGIVNLLAEGYDLLGAKGHGITIIKSGSGLETSYSVLPSPKPVETPSDIGELSATLAELAEKLLESDKNREEKGEGGGKKKGSSVKGPQDVSGGEAGEW